MATFSTIATTTTNTTPLLIHILLLVISFKKANVLLNLKLLSKPAQQNQPAKCFSHRSQIESRQTRQRVKLLQTIHDGVGSIVKCF